MEAPEKIYVHIKKDKVTNTWNNTWIGVHDIEYVRKDTFIEKVENFLEMLGYGFTMTDNITKSLYKTTQLIEDFKKYVEE
jgi:hypothetical protein